MSRRSRLLRWSRFTHRWLGVGALLYFLGMAVSGVLLNHPAAISGLDVPRAWIPGDYDYRTWNRNALRGAVDAGGGARYLYGEAGVWRLLPGGAPPEPSNDGLPGSAYYRDTRALLRVDGPRPYLLAGTRGGLHARPLEGGRWEGVPLPGSAEGREEDAVVDALRAGERVFVVTRSRMYAAAPGWPPRFEDATPARVPEPGRRLPLFRLVFHLHSGAVWGEAGRLLVDAVGLVLSFLCVTGVVFWLKRTRRSLARGPGGALARTGLRWHRRVGLWAVPLLGFVALTGIFQRPPFLVAIVGAAYPPDLHPGPADPNPWHDLLRKALHDPGRGSLVLSTADGFFEGPQDLSRPFRPLAGGPPVSVMGATVLRRDPRGWYWVGSMSGLFVWDRGTGRVVDAFTGRPPSLSARGPLGDRRIVGFAESLAGRTVAADYDLGLLTLDGRPAHLPMPQALEEAGRMSLWHALFEFHNGRIFGFVLGWWTWLLVPLGGLALLAEIGTGVLDRLLPGRSAGHAARPSAPSGAPVRGPHSFRS